MQANEGGVERSICFVERDFLVKDAQLKQMQGDTVRGLGEVWREGGGEGMEEVHFKSSWR
jgi:hypothetical protein